MFLGLFKSSQIQDLVLVPIPVQVCIPMSFTNDGLNSGIFCGLNDSNLSVFFKCFVLCQMRFIGSGNFAKRVGAKWLFSLPKKLQTMVSGHCDTKIWKDVL